MAKCSFCGFDNEDGLLYCEKCKTDLTVPAPAFDATPRDSIATDFEKTSGTEASHEIVQTLHLDKIPLVEALADAPNLGELTRPAPASKDRSVTAAGSSAVLASGPAPTISAPVIGALPREAKPRLIVIRGEKIDMNYPLYSGRNYLGRNDEKPVDIDLENQEPPDRIWTSRQHAVITFENGNLTIEDLNSLNGTFVNRSRVYPGQMRTLQANDIIQVGTVHLRVAVG
jgi:hypothetical protein